MSRPNRRKVAWVVLVVVVICASLSIASVWDQVWLRVAYVPLGPPEDCDSWPSPPPKARTVQFYVLRCEWLPGSAVYVFYDRAGRETARQGEGLVMPVCS